MQHRINVYKSLSSTEWQDLRQIALKCETTIPIVCYRLTQLTKEKLVEKTIKNKVCVYRKIS